MKCHACGRLIEDQFLRALDKTWHTKCFRCRRCKRPIEDGSFAVHEGWPYHAACHREHFGRQCTACGDWIEGAYITALNGAWHPNCFRCAACGRSIGQNRFQTREEKPYHPDCFLKAFAPRCAICNKPMSGTIAKDGWGNRFCTEHERRLPDCFSCGRLICDALTGGGHKLPGKLNRCNLCATEAVEDEAQAVELLDGVRRDLAALGLNLDPHETPLQLATYPSLMKHVRNPRRGRPLLGMARTSIQTRGGRQVARRFEEILIMAGMPREHMQTVAAHELCHAWLFFNHFDGLAPKIEEGLCVLVEYLWLQQQATPSAELRMRAIEQNRDPIYGDGFRAARKAYGKGPLLKLMRYVHEHRTFPGGWFRKLFSG